MTAGVRAFSSVESFQQTHQQFSGRQRFYKQVSVDEATCSVLEDSVSPRYKILLDGRELRTPARNNLHLPCQEMALMVASEWDAQVDRKRGIQPATMPFTTLSATAIDQVSTDEGRERALSTCLGYLPTDTLLFFTEERDRILLKKQKKHYEPLLNWFHASGVPLSRTDGGMVARVKHPQEVYNRIGAYVASLDHFELALLQAATLECKSILLAIALLCGKLPFAEATLVSRLEEEFQVEIWGVVEGGHDMDRLNNKVNLGSIVSFHRLYSASTGRQMLLHLE